MKLILVYLHFEFGYSLDLITKVFLWPLLLLHHLPIHFLIGAKPAAGYLKSIETATLLHHIDVPMQSNAQRTSCCYLSLVTEGHTVCEITGLLVDRGHQPTRISCLLQNLYIKSLWKVTPQWQPVLWALSSELGALSSELDLQQMVQVQ